MYQALTIVIPNFNGAHLLIKNLPSVLRAVSSYPSQASIIVVDDGSTDNSLQVLKAQFLDIKVVVHGENRGFAEAISSGVDAANTELLFFLNSDVQLNSDVLIRLSEYFIDSNVFSVGPLIVDENGRVSRHSWNIRQYKWGSLKPVDWDVTTALQARKNRKLSTLYVSGGSMMVRKSMFRQLLGFHPLYKPFYSEDYDLGLRAWRHGWQSYFEPDVSVVHYSKGSIKENLRRAYVKQVRRRNNYLLEWMHLPYGRLFFCAIPLTIWQLLGEAILLDRVNLKGFTTALSKIPAVIKARAQLQKTQKLSLNEVLKQARG